MSIYCVVISEKRDKSCERHVDTACFVHLRLSWVGKHGVRADYASHWLLRPTLRNLVPACCPVKRSIYA